MATATNKWQHLMPPSRACSRSTTACLADRAVGRRERSLMLAVDEANRLRTALWSDQQAPQAVRECDEDWRP